MNPARTSDQTEFVAKAFEQPDWYLKGYAANIRVRSETVASFTRGKSFGRVLDIGCGDGSLSLPFLSSSCQVTYLDLSSAMLDIVRGRIPKELLPQATFLKGDVTQVELPNASFDMILFVGVLAYVSDVDATARKIGQLLRPGGVLIVECTDAAHFLARVNFGYRDLTAIAREAKCQTFRHRGLDVAGAFTKAGFSLRETFRYTYSMPIASRFLSQQRSYSIMRRLYGTSDSGRNQHSGSEMLMKFELAS